MSREILTADPQMWAELMAKPYRYRQLTIWDWQLPKDDSLEVYRQNLKALKAKQGPPPCRYGHTGGRHRNGECAECRRISDVVRYRTARGIPLDAPINRNPIRTCPHGPGTERTKSGHCKACRREDAKARRQRSKVVPIRPDEQLAFELWDRRREVQRLNQVTRWRIA